jgi:hypothetical protein
MYALTLRHPWIWALLHLEKRIENRSWHPGQHMIGQYIAIHGGAIPKSKRDWNEVIEDVTAIYTRILPKYPEAHVQQFRAYFAEKFPGETPDKTSINLEQVVIPGIVAVAKIGGVVTASDDPWFAQPVNRNETNYGWVLEDVVMLPEAVRCAGAQKLWKLSDDILAQVRDGYRVARGDGRRAA